MAAVPTGFCFVAQITGWMEMELSSSWAASPSSLKRFSGLPTAYPTPSTLQTISACLPASAWKSLPHEGPQGKSSLDRRLQMPRAVETYVPSLIPSCPWLDFLQACLRSRPVVPALPQPLPNPVSQARWPWERWRAFPFLPCTQHPLPTLIFF